MSIQRATQNFSNAALFEKVMLKSDLQGLTPVETVQHIKNVCDSLGLNPLTNPIEVIEFQGKKKLYFRKDATEQLRVIKKVSVKIKETKIVDDLYIVIAEASTPEGRTDSSTGAVVIGTLKGEAKANAIMKAETKAKRRVTLSICGLGFMDESEIESVPNFKKPSERVEVIEQLYDVEIMLTEISLCDTIDELQEVYTRHYKVCVTHRDNDAIKKIIEAKDLKKKQLESLIKEFNEETEKEEEENG